MKDIRPARIGLIVLNTFVLSMSIVIVALGIWAQVDGRYFGDIRTISGVSIGMGLLTLVFTFMGFAGLTRNHGAVLIAYGILIIIIAFIAIPLSAVALGYLDNYTGNETSKGWDNADDFEKTVIQYKYTCCGYMNPSDNLPSGGCSSGGTQGCYYPMYNDIYHFLEDLSISGIILGSFAFFASIPAFLLGMDINNNRERYV